jgi:MATE family multidrug resistance protein
MASMHYGTPSSLPSDYAISSHYANAAENVNTDQHAHDFHDTVELNDTQDDINPDRRIIRRTSLPSPYLRPQPLKPFDSKTSVPDEYTPLLVPRIEEEVDPGTDPVHPKGIAKIYLDEFRTLFKYTLPVMRYALSFLVRIQSLT